MKLQLSLFACWFLSIAFGQEKKLNFKDYFNEFYVSVNHGIPFLYDNEKAFFGGGLGMSHVFRADRVVGARAGLELDFFHFWNDQLAKEPISQSKYNQRFNLTNLSIPVNLQLNFGKKTRFLFEFGGRLGVLAHMNYSANVYTPGSKMSPYGTFEDVHIKRFAAGVFFGLNTGIGARIFLNEKLDLLIRPDLQANSYSLELIYLHARLCIGIHLK